MPIPDYQSIMLPLLKFASDRLEHSLRETIEALADKFGLTGEELGLEGQQPGTDLLVKSGSRRRMNPWRAMNSEPNQRIQGDALTRAPDARRLA
jgi:hypothetical protein